MSRRVKLMCILHFVLASAACAQSHDFTFQQISIEDGLSQNSVFSITQDARGFMWFGTRDGLNRFDSRRIKTYLRNPSRSNSVAGNSVYSLLSDSQGRLWAGTSFGLNLYDAKLDRFDLIDGPAGEESLVTCLMEDSRKDIWLGTHDGLRLLITDTAGYSFKTFTKQDGYDIAGDDVRSIFEDSSGVLWIGTATGLSRLVITGSDTYTFSSYDLPQSIAPKNDEVIAIGEYEHGLLLIGTENLGLLLFDPSRGTFSTTDWLGERNLGPEAVRAIQFNKTTREYLIGTIGGMYIANPWLNEFTCIRSIPDLPNSISDNSVRSLYVDRNGSIWVGTFHGGVNFYSPQLARFKQIVPDRNLPFKMASALATDRDNNLWIGTEGNGLFVTDSKGNVINYFRHLKDDPATLTHNNIKCLLLEEEGIWVGTIKGLNYYDFRRKRFTVFHRRPDANSIPDDAVYDLAKDEDGALWIATYRGGLTKLDPRTGIFTTLTNDVDNPNSLSSEGAISLMIDSRKDMWVGTIAGLNLKRKGSNDFKRYVHDPADTTSLSANYILVVYEDSKGRVWVGTRSNGLNLLMNGSNAFKRIGTREGLSGNTIFDMKEDRKGYLWISTENGISRLDPRDISIHNYDRNDGLACKLFNTNSSCIDATGKFYFGGYNGIVVFNPENISVNSIVPDVRFVGLRVFNHEISIDPDQEEITLEYDQNIFTIDFAVLNYINPGKNRFAYRLSGFEDKWNETREPVATYMNLPPGSYTLFARGSNNDGVWSEDPVSIRLHVTPPPWKSWWAYTIYGCLVLGILLAWSRFNRKRMALEHELEIEHIELRKQEEVHQAKLSFFANIVHEIRTPLTLMTGPVDRLLSENVRNQSANKDLSLLKTNTGRLERLLNQLLDFHKQETGNVQLKVQEENIVEFIDETLLSFKDYAQSRKVTLGFNASEPVIKLWFDREELSKVFFNLLVNAFKFTPGGGAISISVTRQPSDDVKIVVEDTGLGIPQSHLEKIFHRFYQAENSGVNGSGVGIGLALAKGIVDLHHGAITVDSKEATNNETGFTTFTIVLRGGNSHFDATQICESHIDADGLQMPFEPLHSDGEIHGPKNIHTDLPLILLVEDNHEIRTYMHEILSDHYNVVESTDGYHAFGIAIEKLPDLVLSDVMMPRMDGLDLTRQLKNDPRTSHIPVILLTARGALNHQLEGFETGADDYLTKPVNTKLLLAKIRASLTTRDKLKEKYGRIVSFQPKVDEVGNPEDRFLQKLMTIVDEKIMDPGFNVMKLSREIGMSRPVLFRKIKMLTGLSVIDLMRNVRLKKAELLLKQKKLSISEVAFTVGFTDPKYFSKSFRQLYGKSPSQFLEES